MVHFLIRCQTIKVIWNSIIKMIHDGTGTRINLTEKEIPLGVNDLDPFNKLVNNKNMITKQYLYASRCLNTLRSRQNGRYFANDTFKRIFVNENVIIFIEISLKFVPKGPINNIPAS